jgi:hypothetical protein
MNNVKDEGTVLVRIMLWIVLGRLVAGGWLPEDVAAQFTSPAVIEAATSVVFGALLGIWYWLSKARQALLRSKTS